MLARRLLALIAVLLVILAIANAVAPRNASRTPTPPPATTGATPATPPSASAAPDSTGRVVTAELSATPSGRTKVVRARLGDEVDLYVSAPVVGTVTLSGYDLLEAVDPSTPAEFHFIADRAGTFDVLLQEADAVVGRLRVSPSST
jgi:hypothetical protein